MNPRSNRKPAFGQWSTLKKHETSMSSKFEPAILSRATGQRIPCFDSCQLTITWMSNIKEGRYKLQTKGACLCQPISCSMAAILRDSVVVVVAVVRTRPRAMPLAMITMRKSIHRFRFLSYMGMGLRLAVLRATGAPLSTVNIFINPSSKLEGKTNN